MGLAQARGCRRRHCGCTLQTPATCKEAASEWPRAEGRRGERRHGVRRHGERRRRRINTAVCAQRRATDRASPRGVAGGGAAGGGEASGGAANDGEDGPAPPCAHSTAAFAPLFARFVLPVSACPLPRQPLALAARSELCRPCPTCLLARSILLSPSPVHPLLARPIDAFIVFCVSFFFCNPLPPIPATY